jgi:phage-related protein
MNEYEVRLFESALEFLRGLPPKLRTKAYRGIELLATFGPELSMPHARALRNAEGLRELRVKFASDIVRLFYFHHEGKVCIVTSGFVKKSDKTDPRELQRAIRLMRMFKEDAL